MTNVINYLTIIAGVVGSLTVIFGFFYKYILEPWEKKKIREADLIQRERMQQDKEYQDKMVEITKSQMVPVLKLLDEFKEAILNSKFDRQKLTEITEENQHSIQVHEERLDDHGDRILVLETKTGINGGHKTVTYKEHYCTDQKDDED
ncbi:hypothetical protein [Facklamia hominis]